jgi:hypothetical protein
MIRAEYIGENPSIDIEKTKFIHNNEVTITISEFEICLDEEDAKELLDGLEESLIPWEDTRSGLESKIEDLNDEIENLTAALKEYEEGRGIR